MSPASAADPKVPAGRDPGGVAVAIVGGGLDYRRADIASRLARDGEGELVGWDFVEGDRHPFAEANGNDGLAALVVGTSPARIVPVRVAAGNEAQIAQALRLLDDTPTRVVVIAAETTTPIARRNLVLASRQLGRLLIVVPARVVAPGERAAPSAEDMTGLLVVAASDAGQKADVIVESDAASKGTTGQSTVGAVHPDDVAAAHVAALAVRLATPELPPTGAGLRRLILALARSSADGTKRISGIDRLP